MFALSALDRQPAEVSVKCEPELATALRENNPAIRPGYHLLNRPLEPDTVNGSLSKAPARDLIEDSGFVARRDSALVGAAVARRANCC